MSDVYWRLLARIVGSLFAGLMLGLVIGVLIARDRRARQRRERFWSALDQLAKLRADVAAGAGHDCDECRGDDPDDPGRCILCDASGRDDDHVQ